jgi:glycolate oxidase FAD binding subunit
LGVDVASPNSPADTAASHIREVIAAQDQPHLAGILSDALSSDEAVFPLGGQTSLDYGLPSSREGIGLDLTGLNRVVDYVPRDMTITVETGIRMADLAKTLATESQQLPIDVPLASVATLGGSIATGFSGPRRYGYGTLRDYVIGITAVDGRGVTFHGGGRVVKNVAGYDFCKLLIGSLGTLAVITQVTLKVKPLAPARRWLVCRLTEWETAERLLDAMVHTATTPAAVELLAGERWSGSKEVPSLPDGLLTLAVLFEGPPAEVDWQVVALHEEWTRLGVAARSTAAVNGAAAERLLATLTEFPQSGIDASSDVPLVLKAAVPASFVTQILQKLLEADPQALVQTHVGNGIVIARLANFNAADLTRVLVGKLQSAAANAGGTLTVLSTRLEGMTPRIVWGGRQASFDLMESVKRQFDPHNILNPGRFIFP